MHSSDFSVLIVEVKMPIFFPFYFHNNLLTTHPDKILKSRNQMHVYIYYM